MRMFSRGKKSRKWTEGFTLVEILVAVFIFSFSVAIASVFLVSSISNQRRLLASHGLLSQTSYVMEYMTRAIRQAKKEFSDPPLCLHAKGYNYDVFDAGGALTTGGGVATGTGPHLKFINAKGECQEFFVGSEGGVNVIKEKINSGPEIKITSNDFNVSALRFHAQRVVQEDPFQPRVTVFVEMTDTSPPGPGTKPKIQLQATVSERDIDIKN